MMHRTHVLRVSMWLMAALALSLGVSSAMAAPNQGAIDAQKKAADQVRKQASDVRDRYADTSDAVKAATEAEAKAIEAVAEARMALVKAYESEDRDAITAAAQNINEVNARIAPLHEVTAARVQQDRYLDTTVAERSEKSTREGAMDAYKAWIASYGKAADAWDNVAMVASKTDDRETIEKAKDSAIMATYEITLAQSHWGNENRLAQLHEIADSVGKSAEDVKEIEKFAQSSAEALAIQRKQYQTMVDLRVAMRRANDRFTEAVTEIRRKD